MNKVVFTFFLTFCTIFLQAQNNYEISLDTNHTNARVYKGLISKNLLKTDTGFKWYQTNYDAYTPDSSVVNIFKKSSARFVVFGGTWCDDTQFILPRFFKILEQASITDERITFFGVNRNKESLANISAIFSVTNVPTIIVMKDGKEAGRLVEYGKTGNWDKELAEIINQIY